MAHQHNHQFCLDGVCGDKIYTCGHCAVDYHSFAYPCNWLIVAMEHEKEWYNDTTPYYKEFCSPACRDAYLIVYTT